MLHIVLVILALLCFVLAAFSVTVHPRVSLLAVGLALWLFDASFVGS